MVIAGAGGHARELASVLERSGFGGNLFFFDDLTEGHIAPVFGRYTVLRTETDLKAVLAEDPRFCPGTGSPSSRRKLANFMSSLGGVLTSIVSTTACIGHHGIVLGDGLNIMDMAVLTTDITVGKGTLVHVHASLHHDVVVGEYAELSPGCRILGHVRVGDGARIGSGAVILPGVSIGRDAVVGAGAVVIADVPEGVTVAGVPAHPLK